MPHFPADGDDIRQQPPGPYKECAKRKPIVIAVLDTGFGHNWEGEETAHLCRYGHKNFASGSTTDKFHTKDEVPLDDHGHGTHIAGTIDRFARMTNNSYCLVIIKYYETKGLDLMNLYNTVEAINYATKLKVDIINYSGGGVSPSSAEKEAIQKFLDQGGTFVAAAGNEKSDLAEKPYYPAQEDPRIIVVGNGKYYALGGGEVLMHSEKTNFGKRVDRWEDGDNVKTYNYYMTGTSQSAAIATGKIVAEKNKSCK